MFLYFILFCFGSFVSVWIFFYLVYSTELEKVHCTVLFFILFTLMVKKSECHIITNPFSQHSMFTLSKTSWHVKLIPMSSVYFIEVLLVLSFYQLCYLKAVALEQIMLLIWLFQPFYLQHCFCCFLFFVYGIKFRSVFHFLWMHINTHYHICWDIDLDLLHG